MAKGRENIIPFIPVAPHPMYSTIITGIANEVLYGITAKLLWLRNLFTFI
jgi:hypothetical protein